MFTLRDRRTGELFDRWSDLGDKRRRLLERSWAGVFRDHLLVELPVDDLCRHLDERLGRPSKDLHVVIGVLLLQQLHDLSDAATVEALAFNMAWHYALDVRSEADSYFCEKTLRNYRRLFIEPCLSGCNTPTICRVCRHTAGKGVRVEIDVIRHFQHHFLSYSGFSLSTRLAPYIGESLMGQWVRLFIAMNRDIRSSGGADIAAPPDLGRFTRGIGSTLDVVGMGDNRIHRTRS